MLSIVMGVHNAADLLAATLDSVLSQSGVDFEFIVVDDGSTDQTCEVLQTYADIDRRLRILSIPENRVDRGLGCRMPSGAGCIHRPSGCG